MIKIIKKLRKEQDLFLIITELNAKAAHITTEYKKEITGCLLVKHLEKVSDDVENSFVLEHLKKYLIESVFTHYVNMIDILNYINSIKKVIKAGRILAPHSKFLFVTEFKNYIDDQSGDKE